MESTAQTDEVDKILFSSNKLNIFDLKRIQKRSKYLYIWKNLFSSFFIIVANLIGINFYTLVFLNSNKSEFAYGFMTIVVIAVLIIDLAFVLMMTRANMNYSRITDLIKVLETDRKLSHKLFRELKKGCKEIEEYYESNYLKFYITKSYILYTNLGKSELSIIKLKKIHNVETKFEYSFFEGYLWRLRVVYEGIDGRIYRDSIIIPTWNPEANMILELFGLKLN